MINEGTCGAFDFNDCANLRSEGIVLRAAGEGTVVDGNYITNAQSGIFINGRTKLQDYQQCDSKHRCAGWDRYSRYGVGYFTDSLIAGNTVINVPSA